MAFWGKLNPLTRAGIIGATLTLTTGLYLTIFGLGDQFVDWSYTFLFGFKGRQNITEAAIVFMDDNSAKELNQTPGAPWDRALHAKLVERLTQEHAKAVVFDILFAGPGPDTNVDLAFAKAMRENGHVVLGKAIEQVSNISNGQPAVSIIPPYDLFEEAAATSGVVTLELRGGAARTMYRTTPENPTLAWVAAAIAGSPYIAKLRPDAERWLNYYGRPGTIPSVNFSDALSTNGVPPGFFKDRVVFVGAKPTEGFLGTMKDEFPTPYTFWTGGFESPGVEIHATAFLNLMHGDWLSRMPFLGEIAAVIISGLVFGFGLPRLNVKKSSLTAIACIAGIFIVSWFVAMVFFTRFFFGWLMVTGVIIPIALIWAVVYNAIQSYVHGQLMYQSLCMYVSPARAKQIMKHPERMLAPGAHKQELAILFSDIANFTKMSEGMDSDTLAHLMNAYFEGAVEHSIKKTDGTVVKFIGDAIFAIWNAPDFQEDYQALACKGALLLRDQVTDFKGGKKDVDVRTRIGLHSGVANVGNFGSTSRVDYTALGENINLASRMESLNKYLGTDILITGDIEKSVRGRFVTQFLGRFILKGFGTPVLVYELLSLADGAPPPAPFREAFAKAQALFEKREFAAAEAGFHAVLEMKPKHGPSLFYLGHMEELAEHPPGPDWSGEVEMKEK